jgi:hypothetical protein
MRNVILFASAMALASGCARESDVGGGQGGGCYDPCEGKACGDSCTVCAPDDPDCFETAVVKACDANGACVPEQPDMCGLQCDYGGMKYDPGESFLAGDGCNTCGCLEDGSVVCTLIACGASCGGPDDAPCGAGEYCQFALGTCGEGGVVGLCALRPEACAELFQPVCGCDDMTYGNACEAAAAGVSVREAESCD